MYTIKVDGSQVWVSGAQAVLDDVKLGMIPNGCRLPTGPRRALGTSYWITDLGVASMRVTLVASRSIISGTLGAMSFFQ